MEAIIMERVPVIAIPVSSNRYFEIHLIIRVIGLSKTDVLLDTRAAEHYPSKSPIQSILCGDQANIDGSGLPDTILCEHIF